MRYAPCAMLPMRYAVPHNVMTTHKTLFAILTLGLILRVCMLFFFWDKPLTIVDETHYQAIAENILNHHEFALETGHPTSIRPPLYPFFLSAIYFFTGGIHFNAVRVVQIILSLGIICMVYVLGKKIFHEKTGLLASLIFAVYPSFLFFTHFLLTEVLFSLLLMLFIFFYLSSLGHLCYEDQNRTHLTNGERLSPSSFLQYLRHPVICALLAGLFLGLGALTRSVLYPFVPVAMILLFIFSRGSLVQKVKWSVFFFIGCALIIGPWTARNFFLYRDFVPIGTMGGLNMHMGNYEHTPLNRAWAAVDLTGEKTWYYGHERELTGMNEAQKQKWASQKATEFILDHKLLTMKRDLIKGANFWGMERSVIGGIINNHWPGLKKTSCLMGITLAIFSAFAVVVMSSVFGIIFQLQIKRPYILFILIVIMFFAGIHAIVFGHSRYHLPLIPLLVLFSSWSFLNLGKIWRLRKTRRFVVSIFVTACFMVIWVREILFIESVRYLKNVHF